MVEEQQDNFSGILLVDKPSGITSHAVIYKLRKFFGIQKIGHAGTLDPMATGLLIILVGRKATKISQYITGLTKSYEGTMLLGQTTDSCDADGKVTDIKPVPEIHLADLQVMANSFLGEQMQLPPMFSAKKINGKCLYKMARKGQDIERASCLINISEFNVEDFCENSVKFFVNCSKGTYIRTIAHDFGQKIGCGSCLTALRRLSIDKFLIKNAMRLDVILTMMVDDVKNRMMSVDEFMKLLHE